MVPFACALRSISPWKQCSELKNNKPTHTPPRPTPPKPSIWIENVSVRLVEILGEGGLTFNSARFSRLLATRVACFSRSIAMIALALASRAALAAARDDDMLDSTGKKHVCAGAAVF